jgi:hypothetical protein
MVLALLPGLLAELDPQAVSNAAISATAGRSRHAARLWPQSTERVVSRRPIRADVMFTIN